MTYKTVAKFEDYSIIEPCDRRSYERQQQQKQRKADRETVIASYIVGALVIIVSVLLGM